MPHRSTSTLVRWPTGVACASLRFARTALSVLLAPGDDTRGVCTVCGLPVLADDPFLRYGGEYYHAHDCVESAPPGLAEPRPPVARP